MEALTPRDLAGPEVRAWQGREWKVERAGWVVIGTVLLGGLLGVLGDGPLARTSRQVGSGTLDYDRIVRRSAPTELRLRLAGGAIAGETVEVVLGGSLLERSTLLSIQPSPILTRQSDDRLRLEIAVTQGAGESQVIFQIEPNRTGKARGTIEVAGSEPAEFSQFVLP